MTTAQLYFAMRPIVRPAVAWFFACKGEVFARRFVRFD